MNTRPIKFLIPILFAIVILLSLFQRDAGLNSTNNQSGKISPSEETQGELWNFYQKAEQIGSQQETEPRTTSTTFLAVGDIMLSRNVAGTIKKANDPLLPFSKFQDVFNSVDFSFANLESPISGKDHFNPTGSLIFNAPLAYTQGLSKYNFKALTLANNHALDQGEEGLFYTLNYLDSLGIKTTGAGKTLAEAWRAAVVETSGIKICFLGASYASSNDGGKTANNYVARIDDLENLKSSILNLKPSCDFVIIAMHAGVEYTTRPNQAQMDFARKSIDLGADMVIGAHPHWVQTIERYCPNSTTESDSSSPIHGEEAGGEVKCSNPKYIFYSLGNFIFDQEWSKETKEGLALKIRISKSETQNELQGSRTPATLDSIELIPIIIDNYSTPRLADEQETKKILERIGQTDTILK